MLLTVTLNPCIDKMVRIPGFVYGGLNRIESVKIDPAGKGTNLSAVYAALGGDTICTGFNYIGNRDVIEDFLKKEGIKYDFVMVPGLVRTNTKVFDTEKKTVTELNEKGAAVDDDAIDALIEKITKLAEHADYIALGGSVPQGVNTDIYKLILESVNKLDIITILDADGELLREGLKAKPNILKPNEFELETYLGRKLNTPMEMAQGAMELIQKGAFIVAVTMGGDGAVIVTKEGAWYALPMDVDVKGTAGAGDSFLGGAITAHSKGLSPLEMLRWGVAAASDSVNREGTELCRADGFEAFKPNVEIQKLL